MRLKRTLFWHQWDHYAVLSFELIPHDFNLIPKMWVFESHSVPHAVPTTRSIASSQPFLPLGSSSFDHGYRKGPRSLIRTSRQRYVFIQSHVQTILFVFPINHEGICSPKVRAVGGTAQRDHIDSRPTLLVLNGPRSMESFRHGGRTRRVGRTTTPLEFFTAQANVLPVCTSDQVTHCGMGGLYECASNGVPIIPLPFSLSADQPVNAAIAEAAGFAVRPRLSSNYGIAWLKFWERPRDPEFTPAALRDAVAKVLEDPAVVEGANRAKRAALAASYGRVAVDAVEST